MGEEVETDRAKLGVPTQPQSPVDTDGDDETLQQKEMDLVQQLEQTRKLREEVRKSKGQKISAAVVAKCRPHDSIMPSLVEQPVEQARQKQAKVEQKNRATSSCHYVCAECGARLVYGSDSR